MSQKQFSNKTLKELTDILAYHFTQAEVDRVVTVFNFSRHAPAERVSKIAKATTILAELQVKGGQNGPFGEEIVGELIQYVIEDFYRKHPAQEKSLGEWFGEDSIEDTFHGAYPKLCNSLKLDGFIVEGEGIRKLLPEEFEENETESKLEELLGQFEFETSKGHFNQAVLNFQQGNWASANSQFRTFTESLLVEIVKTLLPDNTATSAQGAMNLLSDTLNPPFLSKSLCDVKNGSREGFSNGLWSRLNPEGSHPGLSEEDDCHFRYMITLSFGYYLLNKLTKRIG